MPHGVSLYLDLVRFLSAVAVLLYHGSFPEFGGKLLKIRDVGADAVMAFFVLSGLIMAHVAPRTPSIRTFLVARVSRLWSVLLPAIVLTALCDAIGSRLAPMLYSTSNIAVWLGERTVAGYLGSVVFANELWWVSVAPGTNAPIWSLSYEFGYYLLFACSVFLKGPMRAMALAACLLAIGPKILLLAPAWWCGVLVYRCAMARDGHGTLRWPWLWLVGPLIAYLVLKVTYCDTAINAAVEAAIGNALYVDLRYSRNFVWLNLVAVLVAIHFYAAMAAGDRLLRPLGRVEGAIRGAANITLSLYLCHVPLMMLMAAVLRPQPVDPLKNLAMILATFILCMVIGRIVEPTRFQLRRVLDGAPLPLGLAGAKR